MNDFRNHYEKQVVGDFIEIYYNNELVAEFEKLGRVFVTSNYTHNFDSEVIKDIDDSYKLSGEISPKDLINMLNELEKNYPDLVFVGKNNFIEKKNK